MNREREGLWAFGFSLVLHVLLFLAGWGTGGQDLPGERVQGIHLADPREAKTLLFIPPAPGPTKVQKGSERKVVLRRTELKGDEEERKGRDTPWGEEEKRLGVAPARGKQAERVGEDEPQEKGEGSKTQEQAEKKLAGVLAIPVRPWEPPQHQEVGGLGGASKGQETGVETGGRLGDPQGYLSRHSALIEGAVFENLDGYDLTPWAGRFLARLRRNWRIPLAVKIGVKGVSVLRFELEPSGKLSKLGFLSTSGVRAYDNAAREALLASSPFPPLPPDFPQPRLVGQVRFLYGEKQ